MRRKIDSQLNPDTDRQKVRDKISKGRMPLCAGYFDTWEEYSKSYEGLRPSTCQPSLPPKQEFYDFAKRAKDALDAFMSDPQKNIFLRRLVMRENDKAWCPPKPCVSRGIAFRSSEAVDEPLTWKDQRDPATGLLFTPAHPTLNAVSNFDPRVALASFGDVQGTYIRTACTSAPTYQSQTRLSFTWAAVCFPPNLRSSSPCSTRPASSGTNGSRQPRPCGSTEQGGGREPGRRASLGANADRVVRALPRDVHRQVLDQGVGEGGASQSGVALPHVSDRRHLQSHLEGALPAPAAHARTSGQAPPCEESGLHVGRPSLVQSPGPRRWPHRKSW